MITISLESPNQPDALALIAELDAYQHTLYPAECVYALDLTSIAAQEIVCVVARDNAGVPLGCGALVLTPGYGEIKRMYTLPQSRGLGIAKKILATLEGAAASANRSLLKLETGPLQKEALKLYAVCGYQPCGPFGDYRDDPMSVFMQKSLNTD
jgi:putative acetyltransferase